MSEVLQLARDGAVTTLTLNRPHKLNSLTAELVEAALASLRACCDDGTSVLVIRANGKGFSGGFDFANLEQESDGDLVLRFIRLEQLLQAIFHAPFKTVALVHGVCFGAAADIFCCCDVRVAANNARFRMPGLQFAIVLGTRRLAEVVGIDNARALLETSPVFNASEALQRGFATHVRDDGDWPAIVDQCRRDAEILPAAARSQMRDRLKCDRRDGDLAALVRSAATPGLKQRILDFRSAGSR